MTLDCVLARWQPGIGDPTWQGWLTVLVYLGVAALALRVLRRAPFPDPRSAGRERLFWGVILGLMLVLAVNKQLDLQSALTQAGRCLARAQGWYENRRPVQVGFLLALAGLAGLFLIGLARLLRGSGGRQRLAIAGLVFVCTFVLMRAVGFHHADRFLHLPVLGLRANTALEWTGPALIAASGLRLLRRQETGWRKGRPV